VKYRLFLGAIADDGTTEHHQDLRVVITDDMFKLISEVHGPVAIQATEQFVTDEVVKQLPFTFTKLLKQLERNSTNQAKIRP